MAKGFKVTSSVCNLSSKTSREELIKTVSSVFDCKLIILVSDCLIYSNSHLLGLLKIDVDFWPDYDLLSSF